MENYVLQFNCTYTGVSFSGELNKEDQTSLFDKFKSYFPSPFNIHYTLTLQYLSFIPGNEHTDLEGRIEIEYEKYIPKSYFETLITEVTYEILGYFMIAGTQNGRLTTHIDVSKPKIKLTSYTKANNDLLDSNSSLRNFVIVFDSINLNNAEEPLPFKDYLNRPSTPAIQTAQFWLNIANSNNTDGGFVPYDSIKKFTNIWSAFNALYNEHGEQNSIQSEREKLLSLISSSSYLKTFTETFIQNAKEEVKILLDLDLKLTQGKLADQPLSELFLSSISTQSLIEGYSYTDYFLLILYALRNYTFHGNGYIKISHGARVASDFIEGLVKLILQHELRSNT